MPSPGESRADVPACALVVHVVAHRGASLDVAEHTLAAYERAVELGADALECDVRLTADGVLVCVHDRRVDRTSNGRGPVSTLELAELAELDFASWRGGDGSAGSVLTLDALLGYVHDCGRRVEVATDDALEPLTGEQNVEGRKRNVHGPDDDKN